MNISANTVIAALFVYAPQFYSVDPIILAGYENLYTLLQCQVNAQILSCCGVSVFAFLMAHYLTIAAQAASGNLLGVSSNLHEGDLSIGFNVGVNMSALELTPYGRLYLDLVKRTIVGSFVTNLPPMLGGVISRYPVTSGCCNGFGWGFGNNGFGGGCGC